MRVNNPPIDPICDFGCCSLMARTSQYVPVGDVMMHAELVRQGYAQVATFQTHVKDQALFLELQREAREAKRGLW